MKNLCGLASVGIATMFLAACGGVNQNVGAGALGPSSGITQGLPGSLPGSRGRILGSLGKHRAKHKDLIACSNVTTSSGQNYTVAQLGGGSQHDVESSAYDKCDIGIYISAADGPASLNQTVVNGVFEIGVYLDGAGSKINQTSICVNGTGQNGDCESGSSSSAGTGIDAQNTPDLSVNQTEIDGYAAGFASSPCPNNANDFSINQSTVTNSTYPWSFQGGKIKTNHDSPTPPDGGSCAGSGIGPGAPPQVPALFVDSGGAATVSAFTINETTGALTAVAGSPYSTGSNAANLTVDSTGNYLYVADNGDISAFAINPTTAALTPVSGSPFAASGLMIDVAVDPNSNFLYASDLADGLIDGYTINETNGALTPMAGSPFTVGQYPQGLSVDPLGPYLCVTYSNGNGSIQMYAINSVTGALTSAAGPYTLSGSAYAAVVYPGGQYLYAPSEANEVYGFAAASNGALTAISGSPWGAGSSPRASAITPAGTFLYVPNEQSQNIYGYQVNPSSGALTSVSGSPFNAGSNPEDVKIDAAGSFLYAAISNNQDVWAYAINQSSGALAPISGSPYSVSGNGNYLTIRGSSVGGQWGRHHHLGRHRLLHLGS